MGICQNCLYRNALNQEKIDLMKRLLPCFLQALLLVCLLVANATAQDESPNKDESSKRDVSELSVDELRTYGELKEHLKNKMRAYTCLLYTSPSPRDATLSRMPSSA